MTKGIRQGEDWAEFRTIERGPEDHSTLTVEIASGFNEAFKDELKDALPWECRQWDKEAKVWRIPPRYLELAKRIACRHFSSVTVVEGLTVRDLKSGATQEGLFT